MFRTRVWWRLGGLALAAALLGGPARAAEVDKYLPADTETLSVVNVRQILDSALVKKVGLEQVRELLKQQQEVATTLKELGLDPFKDIDKIIGAGPASGEQDKGLLIIHGRFDLDKFRARAEKAAMDNKDVFKILKVKDGQGGEHTVYQFAFPNPGTGMDQAMFAGFASKNTVLAAPSKDYLIDGLKVKAGAKPALKSKAFQELLAKVDDQQSMYFAAVGEVLTKPPFSDLPVKDQLAKITALAGGFTITDGIKMEITVSTKEAADARMLKDKLTEGLNTGLALLALAAMNQKELAPLLDV